MHAQLDGRGAMPSPTTAWASTRRLAGTTPQLFREVSEHIYINMKYPLCFLIFYHISLTADHIFLSLCQLRQPNLHIMPEFLAMAVDECNIWENIEVLLVKFLGGTESIQKRVEMSAKEWENHANIKFCFVSDGNAHIRVSFDQKIGSHSKVGRAALLVMGNEPTMNLAVTDSTPLAELKRQVLHEFGHALGCIHEHCSPGADIQWNVEEVYSYYKKKGWDKLKVDQNIFQKYSLERTKYSKFDPESIMAYRIPGSLTETGFSIPYNCELSARDKKFIAKMYPKLGGWRDFSSQIANAITATVSRRRNQHQRITSCPRQNGAGNLPGG
jgi:hypothetical protein